MKRLMVIVVIALALFAPAALGVGRASDQEFTTLDVDGEPVRIYRDEFGVPHIFAESNRGLFEAYGYVVAQDRLWQLELNRRAALGRLAEIFGAGMLAADRLTRTVGYTDMELDAQFAALTLEEQEIITAYAGGITRYLTEVVAPDPLTRLPFEFHERAIGIPALWTARDVVAVAVRTARPAPANGRELVNQSLLNSLIAMHGVADALDIFDDVYWLNDPDAPTSVPAEGAIGKRQKPGGLHASLFAQLNGASDDPHDLAATEARAVLDALGIPTKLGSHAWVVSPAKSANGSAMLFGGPQQGIATPSIVHEVQLNGGNGFKVTGAAIAGIPLVIIGRTDHIAWSLTAGLAADVIDHYSESLCGGGAGYLFNGVCTPFDVRTETISVRGRSPEILIVQRSVHGPVVAAGPGVRFSQKRSFWMREISDFQAVLGFNRARNIQQFEEAVEHWATSFNVLYADKSGNIAYWLAGRVPVRPEGFDPRLPFPGDGSAEWPGGLQSIPKSINPDRGWLANWNDKPAVDYDSPDRVLGKQTLLREIEDRLGVPGLISLEDMRDIAKDIARIDKKEVTAGRAARFLKPYLLSAIGSVPPTHALAGQAKAVLAAWDGSEVADAITSTHLEPGQVVFSRWLDVMFSQTFGDELGETDPVRLRIKVGGAVGVGEQGTPILINMLIHVLDNALGGGSGVPPSRDYFNGVNPNVVISRALDQALAALGPDRAVWSSQPRDVIRFRHALFPVVPEVGSLPDARHASYAQIVILSRPAITGENIQPLGQSGFLGGVPPASPVLDPHFRDQLELYRNFEYKPMRLYRNIQLDE